MQRRKILRYEVPINPLVWGPKTHGPQVHQYRSAPPLLDPYHIGLACRRSSKAREDGECVVEEAHSNVLVQVLEQTNKGGKEEQESYILNLKVSVAIARCMRVRESVEKIRKFADTQVGEGEREIGGVIRKFPLMVRWVRPLGRVMAWWNSLPNTRWVSKGGGIMGLLNSSLQ